ncbi:FeoA family protein [Clostridium sp.]|uniref:FeoA family protein n=1 Tax=Clostridium sp. TaxID=1506 RepID=UPI00262C2F4E|nr:FeoA family protein [Clostridium sp.]
MMPMALAKGGSSIQVERILLDDTLGKRLREIGISKGNDIEIIKNDSAGLILGINGSRLALDKTLAQKIFVREIND